MARLVEAAMACCDGRRPCLPGERSHVKPSKLAEFIPNA
jgi:hypothetical protein